MSGKIVSRYCQAYRVHCDLRLLAGTPGGKAALAIEARKGQDRETGLGRNDESAGPQDNAQNQSSSRSGGLTP